MNKLFNKKCDASMRVFLTLMFLIKKPSSIYEIIEFLKEKDPYNKIYTPEVILKYINTLRYFGVRISKENEKYIVLNYPPYIDLDEKEIKGLESVKDTEFIDEKSIKEQQNLLFNIERKLSDKTKIKYSFIKAPKTVNYYQEKNKDIIEKINSYIENGQIIKLVTKKGNSYIAKPVEIMLKGKNKIIFKIYIQQKGKTLDIDLSDIDKMEQLSLMSNSYNFNSGITYRLSGKLAYNYTLREGEKLTRIENDNSIVITNTEEAENSLLKRLMRYDSLCEVLAPIETRINMKNLIDSTLSLYEGKNFSI